MLHLYTKNDDGTINYYGEGSYDVLLSYIKKHDLDDYALTTDEPVTAQGKYWLDSTNSDYLTAKALDDKAQAEAEANKEPTLAEQLATLQANFTQLQSDYDIMTEALDSLIMDDDSTEAESDSSDSDTTTTSN